MKISNEEWEELASVCMDFRYGCVILVRDNETLVEEEVTSLKPGDIVLGSVDSLEDPEPTAFDNIPEEYRIFFHKSFVKNFGSSLVD